jgi:hypothetical protein
VCWCIARFDLVEKAKHEGTGKYLKKKSTAYICAVFVQNLNLGYHVLLLDTSTLNRKFRCMNLTTTELIELSLILRT